MFSPEMLDLAARAVVPTSIISAIVGSLIVWLVIAGLLKLLNCFTGERASFQSLFTVTLYSYLPLMLASIISTVLIMMTPAQNIGQISTSLALFLPENSAGSLYMILSKADPFMIWGLVLLAIGSARAMKTTYITTAVFIGVLWLVYIIISGLLTPAVFNK